ncbi:MAG: hypothetical protein WB588_11550 [Dehalococcoidia bacterium]
MSDDSKHIKIHTASSLAGTIWFMGWLFTIGYVKLLWWQIIVGMVIWPYFIGAALK